MAIVSEPFAAVFEELPALANSTRHEFSVKTLHIPMTQSRTFRSVTLRVHYLVLGGVAVTSRTVGIRLGAAAFSDVVDTATLANAGESEWHSHDRDITAYFNANFGTGVSQTIQAALSVTSGALGTSVISAEIFGVVEYEDTHVSANTRCRHVAVDLDSPLSTLTTTLTSLGTFDLSGLPEAGITVRQVWFEVEGQSNITASTAHVLELAVNAEPGVAMGSMGATSSANMPLIIWTRDDLNPLVPINFLARCVDTTGRYPNLSVRMHVFYTYNHAASTRLAAWTRWPLVTAGPGFLGPNLLVTIPGYVEIDLQDPGTIGVLNASVVVYHQMRNVNGDNIQIGVGTQTRRVYSTPGLTGVRMAGFKATHLWGPGALAGTQASLVTRGRVRIPLTIGKGSPGSNQGAVVVEPNGHCSLLTTHDKPVAGDGVCTKTYDTPIQSIFAGGVSVFEFQEFFNVPVQGVAGRRILSGIGWIRGQHRDPIGAANFGYTNFGTAGVAIAGETLRSDPSIFRHHWRFGDNVPQQCYVQAQHPIDLTGIRRSTPDPVPGGIDLSVPRTWRISIDTQGRTLYNSLGLSITSHGYRYPFGDRLLGFTGGGSGIPVEVYRADTHELVARATSTAGGFFTADVFDDTVQYYAAAQQSSTRFGRTRTTSP